MSTKHAAPSYNQTTAFSQGGCLSGFLIPPLAVVCVGLVLALIWLGSGPISTLAAAPGHNEASLAPGTMTQRATLVANPVEAGPISPIFRPEVQYWSGAIRTWAAAAGLDPNLVATVMQIESCGDPRAFSRAGAMGLFQVMPGHFSAGDDPYNPDTNASRGLAYLSHSLEVAHGDARLALAGYNGGTGVIGRSESSWAAETQRYAYWGSGIYAEASSGAAGSLRLQEWMAAGGASLCRQARSRLGINP
jgi:soluble lytic murein transglycosylase-like protein